jgi:hypothetical protein
MPVTHRNRLVTAISNTPGSTGALTIAAAASGYRTFGAADDGLSFDVSIVDGTAWEIRTGCVYTHAGTSLARGTLEDSSTGAGIALTSAAVVTVTMSAGMGNALEVAMQSITPGGRLTLESGVPISTTDQIAKTTIYYTPYVHNTVPLWDGSGWIPTTFTEKTLPLGTITASKCYDVFGYLSAGALALEMLVWTNDTTRATAVTLQDGRYCKSGDKTRLLLGTFYTTSTTTTESSVLNRFLANHYNSVPLSLSMTTGDAGHTYLGAVRAYNNSAANRVQFITSMVSAFDGVAGCILSNTTSGQATDLFLGYDSTTAVSDYFTACSNLGTTGVRGSLAGHGTATAGMHYMQLLERSSAATGNFSYAVLRGNIEC